jgi:nucleotide-binding universal stress UspA family protein
MDEHPILVGYDGASGSGAALRWALSEAARRGVGIRLARVLETPPGPEFAGEASSVEAHMLDEARVTLDKVVAEEAAELGGAVPITTVALPGPVVETLCEQSGAASMIVVGSRGMGGFAGLLLGSVSMAVAAHAHCPVVVVRESMSAVPHGPVIVGVDGSDEGRLAVEFAFAEAHARRTALEAVHAAPPPPRPADRVAETGGPVPAAVLEAALHDCRERYPDVPVTARVLPGSPGHAVAGASRTAQLLVVGSRGRGGFHGLVLGSVSQQVLYRARCPVAVVRRYPAALQKTLLHKQGSLR